MASSTWHPGERASPLRAWSARQLDVLRTTVAHALTHWREDWALPCEPAQVLCRQGPPGGLPSTAALGLGLATDPHARGWWFTPPDAEDQMRQALFGPASAGGPMARAVAGDALQAARLGVAAALRLTVTQPSSVPVDLSRPWRGVVHLELPPPLGLLLLDGEAVALSASPAAAGTTEGVPLRPVAQAVAGQPLALEARLRGCALDLGVLARLVPGDVLRLPHRVDEPARLVGTDGRCCAHGWLVDAAGRRAVELASGPADAA